MASSAPDSITAAVEGLLEVVVATQLGVTPPGSKRTCRGTKRKLSEPASFGGAQSAVPTQGEKAEGGADAQDEESATKRSKATPESVDAEPAPSPAANPADELPPTQPEASQLPANSPAPAKHEPAAAAEGSAARAESPAAVLALPGTSSADATADGPSSLLLSTQPLQEEAEKVPPSSQAKAATMPASLAPVVAQARLLQGVRAWLAATAPGFAKWAGRIAAQHAAANPQDAAPCHRASTPPRHSQALLSRQALLGRQVLPQAAPPPSDFRMETYLPEEWSGQQTRVGGYVLEGSRYLGSGGLGTVYPARHLASGQEVAIKMGHKFNAKEGRHDFSWYSAKTEWNNYVKLDLGRGLPWCPEVYEMGLVCTATGVAPWMTMSLLGPSLHVLIQTKQAMRHFASLATGALEALQALHARGLIHHDVKPANFCTQLGFVGGAGAQPQVALVDLGFTLGWNPELVDKEYSFCGTPDYSSGRVLRSGMPSPKDDIESLGYLLLEMWRGELPWDITKRAGGDHCSDSMDEGHTSAGWSAYQLKGMADRRDRIWGRLVAEGCLPTWIVDWVEECRWTDPAQLPNYDYLRGLIPQGSAKAAAAAAAAAPLQAEE